MNIQERLRHAKAAGNQYKELAEMFDAAITDDSAKLAEYQTHKSGAVSFASYCNPKSKISSSDLKKNPLIKFAAVFNPSTTTELLDEIGLNQGAMNPVISETIYAHSNVSNEYQAFFTIADLKLKEDEYGQYEDQKFFREAILDDDYNCLEVIDLESLEALFYLFILGFIDAPNPTDEFWEYFLDAEPKNLDENLELFGSLPAIPHSLYDWCDAVVVHDHWQHLGQRMRISCVNCHGISNLFGQELVD